ncbi:MFS transporter [Paenibacillus larvae]
MPKKLWLLVMGMFINVTGASFIWPLNTIYIHYHLGKALAVAGFVLTLNSFASVVGSLLGGYLFDRIGSYRTVVQGVVLTLAAATVLAFNHDWWFYVVCLIVMGLGSGMVVPSIYASAGLIWPSGGSKTFAAIYVAQNAGVALGSSLGGYIASYSFDYIFWGNAAVYALFTLLVVFTFKRFPTSTGPVGKEKRGLIKTKLTSSFKALLIICGAYILCWLAYTQWQATISVHMQSLSIDLKKYSLLWTINGILIVFGQPVMTALIPKIISSLKKQIILGILVFIASFGILLVAREFKIFLVAMIIISLGEMLVWPAIPTIANKLAPENRLGMYQGVVNSAGTIGKMLGPLLGGILVDLYNIYVLFILLIALLFVSILIAGIYDRGLKKRSSISATTTSSGPDA